jgi:hypothetical protein
MRRAEMPDCETAHRGFAREIPPTFNFGGGDVDRIATERPDHPPLTWVGEDGSEERRDAEYGRTGAR